MADRVNGPCRRPQWCDLFRCSHIASDPAKLWFAALGLILAVLAVIFALALVLEVRQFMGGETSRHALQCIRAVDVGGACRTVWEGVQSTWTDLGRDLKDIKENLWSGELMYALERAHTLRKVVPWSLLIFLLMGLPWAYCGAAISRAAAVEYATGERITTAEAHEFATTHYGSYFWPPVVVGVTMAALLGCVVLMGLAAGHLVSAVVLVVGVFVSLYLLVAVKQKAGSSALGGVVGLIGLAATVCAVWLLWGVGLLWLGKIFSVLILPLAIALALASILLLFVLLFGRGLMTSAISFEATDSFDAVTRAGDYVLKRPWRLVFYWVVGLLYGIVSLAVVLFLAAASFVVGVVAVWAGFSWSFADIYDQAFAVRQGASFLDRAPGLLLGVLICVLGGLVAAWCLSFVQTLRAISYALLRKSVDLSDTSEVYLEAGRLPPVPPLETSGGTEHTS